MKHLIVGLLLGFASVAWGEDSGSLALIGKIPGEYLNLDSAQNHLGFIKIHNRTIVDLQPIVESAIPLMHNELQAEGFQVLVLQRGSSFDVIYPGLIDLHGHNKQNMIPTWKGAEGRFANRYEWRLDSNEYKKVMSRNVNPWVQNQVAELAAYRWSELQAMVLGTTYLQGGKYYDLGFAIQSVEDPNAYISSRLRVDSTGDMIDPFQWSFLWNVLRPVMATLQCENSYECYKKAASHYLGNHCAVKDVDPTVVRSEITNGQTEARVPRSVVDNIGDGLSVQWLLVASNSLAEACPIANSPELVAFFTKTRDNVNLPHAEIVEKNNYLDNPNRAAIITHLAEGRRLDPASWTEFQLLKLAGLAREGMNFIHGNSLTAPDFQYMADNNMGLIWSPYSNFLLYGETVDIKTALEQGVRISLGSDWRPSGSNSVLEELKVATDYLEWQGIAVSDQTLYEMVTKNAALTMNHFGFERVGEQGIGTLQKGAMGTVIVTSENDSNPYTNLVRKVGAADIQLVVIDGNPIYGTRAYVESIYPAAPTDVMSGRLFDFTLSEDPQVFPPKQGAERLATLGSVVAEAAAKVELGYSTACAFPEEKVLVLKKSDPTYDPVIEPILQQTGLDLNSYSGITRFLGIALLSQSHNVEFDGTTARLSSGAVTTMPPLYSCEDQDYLDYLTAMAKPGTDNKIMQMALQRNANRTDANLVTRLVKDNLADRGSFRYSVPHQLAIQYGFESELQVPPEDQSFTPIVEVPLAQ